MKNFKRLSGAELRQKNRMTRKLNPYTRHTIVKNYLAIKRDTSAYSSITALCEEFKISRNVPSKLIKKFQILWDKLYPDKKIDYTVNVFLKRDKLREHRILPSSTSYRTFVKKYPRAGYQSYEAHCAQRDLMVGLKEGMYYYYKDSTKREQKSVTPSKKKQTYKHQTAKEWYTKQYKSYDLIIHLDGKSMEDQERVWKNSELRLGVKRVSVAVEAQSGAILGLRLEKSHNKSNAMKMIKEICRHVELTIGEGKRILFITDAGSEYLNKKELRGIEVTDLDTSRICKYLREKKHSLRITRKPQDNGFVENKNDYIERACLDDMSIMKMNKRAFVEHLERFMQLNNRFLKGSRKSFRTKGITPLGNIQSRFGTEVGENYMRGLHCVPIESLYTLPTKYVKADLCEIILKVSLRLPMVAPKKRPKANRKKKKTMHPKSLDSSLGILRSYGLRASQVDSYIFMSQARFFLAWLIGNLL